MNISGIGEQDIITTKETRGRKKNELKLESKEDAFLRNQLAYKVRYPIKNKQEKIAPKVLSRYTASMVQLLLKLNCSSLSENSLLQDVTHITEYCNLKGTNATSLPHLKEVGLNLTLDSSSGLENLSGLKKIGGALNVIASGTDEMNTFLQRIGIMTKEGTLKPIIEKGIKLFKK